MGLAAFDSASDWMRYDPPSVRLTFDEELWTGTDEVEVSAGDIEEIG